MVEQFSHIFHVDDDDDDDGVWLIHKVNGIK